MPMSQERALWVSAPTLMMSTPLSAMARTVSRLTPPEASQIAPDALQARDLQALDVAYKVMAVQPVDMFPHTPHVENVVLLEEKL